MQANKFSTEVKQINDSCLSMWGYRNLLIDRVALSYCRCTIKKEYQIFVGKYKIIQNAKNTSKMKGLCSAILIIRIIHKNYIIYVAGLINSVHYIKYKIWHHWQY